MFGYGKELDLQQVSSDPSRRLTILERLATGLLQKHV